VRTASFTDESIFPVFAGCRVDSFERSLIEDALRNSGGNQSEAARQLHVNRATLSYKMKAYGL